jgi:hypothetical protein
VLALAAGCDYQYFLKTRHDRGFLREWVPLLRGPEMNQARLASKASALERKDRLLSLRKERCTAVIGVISALAAVAALGLISFDANAENYVAEVSCTKGPYRLKLPKSYKALRALAPLRREKVLGKEDRDGYTVTYRELRFTGLELEVVTFSNDPSRYLVSSAVLSTPAWKIGGQLRVGSPAKSALRGLARDELPKEGELEFSGETDSIHVTLAAGRVLDVEYSCNTD